VLVIDVARCVYDTSAEPSRSSNNLRPSHSYVESTPKGIVTDLAGVASRNTKSQKEGNEDYRCLGFAHL
jgi:hypothetical protein